MANKNSKVSIDVGLAALCANAAEGQTLSIKDIADVCECNRNAIAIIQCSAFKTGAGSGL